MSFVITRIPGFYARDVAEIVVTRDIPSGHVRINLGAPSVTLDAAGHHELLQALAFPPAQPDAATPAAAVGTATPPTAADLVRDGFYPTP